MKRLFEIQTLSDQQYSRLSQLEFIPGIIALIPGLFPNLFGSERTSREVFNKLFPSNGFWTSSYKNYLLSKIKYIKDIERDLHQYTGEFILQNLSVFCPNWTQGQPGEICWEGLYRILKTESMGGGTQPPPGFNYQTLLLVGGGVLLLLALSKKKSRRKK